MTSPPDAVRWSRLQELLEAVLPMPAEQRDAELQRRCDGDDALRAEALALLEHVDALPERMPAAGFAALQDDDPRSDPSHWLGRSIGPFQIDECLGRGGSSLVFRAHRRDDFAQRVALKLLHGVGTPARRFLREREFLAAMNHPGIGRLFDAGSTDEGVPYLVLELVEGRRWDEELVTARPSLAWRLERFARVCDAVAHAHQHLLVHRDIKPANLIVDAAGEPHLLDFGIATLIGDGRAGEFTRELGPALTPAYAAPEQVRGEPASTATDVHALGALLFETVTGDNPFREPGDDAATTLRAVTERVAPKPSVRLRERAQRTDDTRELPPIDPARLEGDLDTIVAKALAKEPAARYASARQLGDDVRAHLQGRPIWARAPTWRYLAGRFAARHRLGVGLALAALLALFAALALALWQNQVARAERALAEQRLVDVRGFVSSVLFDYHEGIQQLAGSLPMQRRMVEDALRYLETLRRDAGDDPTLWHDLAEGYLKIGDVQGNPYAANLGNFSGAAHSYARAAAAIDTIARVRGEVDEVHWLRARLAARQAHLLHQDAKLEPAAARYRDALAQFERLPSAAAIDVVLEHATTLDYYGDLLGREGATSLLDPQGAQRAHAQSRALRERALQREPANERVQIAIYHSQLRAGEDLIARGEMVQAEAELQRTLATIDALHRARPDDAYRRREVALVYTRLAPVQDALGQTEAAIASALQAFRRIDAMAQADPDNDAVLQGVTGAAGWAARLLIRAQRYDEAAPIVARQIDANQRRLRQAPGNADVTFGLSLAHRRRGELLAGRGEAAEAILAHAEALQLQLPLAALAPEYALGVPLSRAHIGRNELKLGRHAQARASLATAVDELRMLIATEPEAMAGLQEDLADMLDPLGQAALGTGDCLSAGRAWRDSLTALDALSAGSALLPPQQQRRESLQQRLRALPCAN